MSSSPPLSPTAASPVKSARRKTQSTWQVVALTIGALGLYVGIRQLPTGTNLSHLDFRVAGGNSIEFCDPANPQFIPVVAVRSPVSLTLATNGNSVKAEQPADLTASLSTSSGKPIGPPDLLVAHTEKLHLLIFDPDLLDYQHVHPVPAKKAGDWTFSFTPHRSGKYRVFADFTPAATGRSLYASADLDVTPGSEMPTTPGGGPQERQADLRGADVVQNGIVFRLRSNALPLKARAMSDFEFSVERLDGSPVQLQPVMDAYAHLVAIDRDRSGFAHLHPTQLVSADGKPTTYSKLQFKVLIPNAGRYVIWSQIRIDGREYYAPFWFDVVNG